MAMRPNVGSGQQNIEKPVRVVGRARMEIVILAVSWRFGSEICNLVEERPPRSAVLLPSSQSYPHSRRTVPCVGYALRNSAKRLTTWVGHLFGLQASAGAKVAPSIMQRCDASGVQ